MSTINYAGSGILAGMFTACTMLDRKTVNTSDSQFGTDVRYVDGERFDAMIVKNRSAEAQIAERQGLTEQYTVVVQKGLTLRHNDVFRRESDGATFRVTGTTVDGEAPDISTIQIAKTTAERWVVPK